MRKVFIFLGTISWVIGLSAMFTYNNAQATLLSTSLDLSGNLKYSAIGTNTYTTEVGSTFSGTDSTYLSFARTGAYTGRNLDALIELTTINSDNHLLTMDYAVSALDPNVYGGPTIGLGLGYGIYGYAYLTFTSATDEQVKFTKAYTGNIADQSYLYDPDGNSYSLWGDNFAEITFGHLAGETYEYRYQLAYTLGGGNQAWEDYLTLNIETISGSGPSDPVPEPATMLLFGTGLVGLVGSRLRKKKK